jgi:hypothetical protein
MLIAEQKRKENIAEYLLYMFQIEDLIRANEMDLDRIESTLINQFDVAYEVKREMREWYKTLVIMMQEEKKEKTGHLNILNNIVDQMNEMHQEILKQGYDTNYKTLYEKAKNHLEALRMRSGHSNENDIQVALNGLYGLLILKLKKTKIAPETKNAFNAITELVAELNLRYMESRS